MSTAEAILRQKCPRCREGRIFRGGGWRHWLAVNDRCSVCGLRFQREQGYFVGAAYMSYGLSLVPVLALVVFFWRIVRLPYDTALFAAAGAYLPVVPFVARFARVLWIHLDQSLDPSPPSSR